MDDGEQAGVGTGSAGIQGLIALQESARRRGFRPVVAALLAAAGMIPAGYATTVRGSGYSDVPIILALFLVGPVVLLLLWTIFDREGQAARELTSWLKGIQRTYSQAGQESRAVVAVASIPWRNRSFQDVSVAFSTALMPLAQPGQMRTRIIISRFIYPILWAAGALAVIAAFALLVGLTPECTSIDPALGSICH